MNNSFNIARSLPEHFHDLKLGIVGATGLVGETILSILAKHNFPAANIFPMASEQSAGKKIGYNQHTLSIMATDKFNFNQLNVAIFSAGKAVSAKWVPKAVNDGCIVIDNTSCFRYASAIPLVVPEVNPSAISQYKNTGIIANPNCSTIQLLVAIKPLYDTFGIKRLNIASYQSVAGSGRAAINELKKQTQQTLNKEPLACQVYPKPIAFNTLPQIDVFEANGYTREEMKMVWETQKILNDAHIAVNPTCVRVPTLNSHSLAVHLETGKKATTQAVRECLIRAPGVRVIDERVPGGYPTALTDATGQDDVFVGRIREDISSPAGINLWVVADNLRKGAALNTIQILQALVNRSF